MAEHSSSNLSAEVFSVLKARIVRWEYAPGHRFTEEALCEEFGISRSPIREALRMLVENKLVEKTPHKGYSVRQLDLQEIQELYDVRLALEYFVVEKVVERGFPEDELDALSRQWQGLMSNPGNAPVDFAALDEKFHETLVAWTSNRTLWDNIRLIDERLHFIRMTDVAVPGRLMATCVQHLRILDCIKHRDAAGARQAVRTNIEEGRRNVEHAIKEALARAYMSPKAGV